MNIYIQDIAAWCKVSGLDNLMLYGSKNKNLYLNGEKVTNLIIPNGVKSIGVWAFSYCSGLTSVTIPDSVTSIGECVFYYCGGLNTVYYKGTREQWDKISIDDYNNSLIYSTRYYYSRTKPTKEGNYWHYGTDGVTPVIWKH